jgi:hypothetical protein
MGFFKNIFKRKKGGTKVGNFLRGSASAMSGGLLGSGQGLAKWEAEQRGQISPVSTIQPSQPFFSSPAYQGGQSLVNNTIPQMATSGNTPPSPTVGSSIMRESLKKKWHVILLVAGALVGATYFITRKKGGRRK